MMPFDKNDPLIKNYLVAADFAKKMKEKTELLIMD